MNAPPQVLTFQAESYRDIEEELIAILPEHYDELAVNKQRKKLNPDYDRYRQMADSGVIHIPTARNFNGELVGYWIFFVTNNLHYKDITTAYNDIFFLRKSYRKGFAGIRFFKFMLEYLQSIGVDEVYCATKLHNDFGALFEHFGFGPVERTYTKLLDGSKNEGA